LKVSLSKYPLPRYLRLQPHHILKAIFLWVQAGEAAQLPSYHWQAALMGHTAGFLEPLQWDMRFAKMPARLLSTAL
jgi:hypothetical protein